MSGAILKVLRKLGVILLTAPFLSGNILLILGKSLKTVPFCESLFSLNRWFLITFHRVIAAGSSYSPRTVVTKAIGNFVTNSVVQLQNIFVQKKLHFLPSK